MCKYCSKNNTHYRSSKKKQKWMIIVYENSSLKSLLSNKFFSDFAAKGTIFNGYQGLFNESQPNYIAMIAGNNYNIVDSKTVNVIPTSAKTIVDLLEAKGYTWKAYAENYPSSPVPFLGTGDLPINLRSSLTQKEPCNIPTPPDYSCVNYAYVRKHFPFISFETIANNPSRAAKLVNASVFFDDFKNDTLPDFIFYTPNDMNNGHDTRFIFDFDNCKLLPNMGRSADYCGEAFHNTFTLPLSSCRLMKNRIVAVITDESNKDDLENNATCILYGSNVKKNNIVSTKYNHYNLLRTVEDTMKLGTLGQNDSTSLPMTGWKNKYHK
jgi:hypothetical protein